MVIFENFVKRLATAIILMGSACLAFYFLSATQFILLLGLILFYILLVEWPRFNLWWLTPLYPVVPFLALMHLYLQDSMLWAWLVMVVAGYDTGGYIFGNLFGKNKIAPTVSPGKSWQGLVGGILFAGFVAIFAGVLLFKNCSYGRMTLYLVACCTGFFAFLGDLFESYLKRQAKLKDSGALLPGHGGILDRVDGLLFAAIVFDVLIIFLG